MDERSRDDDPTQDRARNRERKEEGLPPHRPITEWTREAEEARPREDPETPGVDVPPG